MIERPRVLLSAAMSVDGAIDDTSDRRLLLSNEADFDRVDALRADCDAVMVGAETIRRDNPRLLVNSEARRTERVARGLPEYPLKATITSTGNLDPAAKFFTTGGGKVVYCASRNAAAQARRFGDGNGDSNDHNVDVVDAGDPIDLSTILDDLAERGVRTLMVEGGTSLHTAFLTAGLADEIHLAIAPFFVGDPAASRFVASGAFPQDQAHRMTLAETRQVGDMVFVRYVI